MSENNEANPPTKQERLGQWLCMVGVVFLLLSFFATAFNFGWLLMGAGLVAGGYLLIHKAEEDRRPKAQPSPAPKRKPKAAAMPPACPEDDPAFMAQLARRIRRPDSTD